MLFEFSNHEVSVRDSHTKAGERVWHTVYQHSSNLSHHSTDPTIDEGPAVLASGDYRPLSLAQMADNLRNGWGRPSTSMTENRPKVDDYPMVR